MLIVDGVLVSDDIVYSQFVCDLSQCQGICCVEGDAGAPLDEEELGILEDLYPAYKPYMTEGGIRAVEQNGFYEYDTDGTLVTPLIKGEACAYIYYEAGVAKCAIEKAYLLHKTPFRKPISCHLYPIRIKSLPGYDALNYHRWHVCEPACSLGKKLNIPVYRFLEEPLVRKYGVEWYQKLLKEIQLLTQDTDSESPKIN